MPCETLDVNKWCDVEKLTSKASVFLSFSKTNMRKLLI